MFDFSFTFIIIDTITDSVSQIGLFLGYTILQAASTLLSILKSLLKSIFGCKDDKNKIIQVDGQKNDQFHENILGNLKAIHHKIHVQDINMKLLKNEVDCLKEKTTSKSTV